MTVCDNAIKLNFTTGFCGVGITVRGVLVISPALLQSTVKVFFWPMKALERPDPRDTTLLASDENLGKEAKDPAMVDDLVTVSTSTDEVS